MKLYISSHKLVIPFMGIMFILSSCTSWHYHHPRVQVEARSSDKTKEVKIPTIAIENTPTTSQLLKGEDKQVQQVLYTEIASTEKVVTTPVKKSKDFYRTTETKVKKDKKGVFFFTEKLMQDHQLFKVKNVEKTALSGWIRIMIILFVVGFALLVVGIVLSITIFGGLWWLFYMFGSLCILAGFIVLILGLVGVMA